MSIGYQKLIANPTNKAVLAASSLQSAVLSYIRGQAPTYPLLKNFWDTLVDEDESPDTLSAEDINDLKTIALAAHMKFSFSDDGKMIL